MSLDRRTTLEHEQWIRAGYRQWLFERNDVVERRDERLVDGRRVELGNTGRCPARRTALPCPPQRRYVQSAVPVLQHALQRTEEVRRRLRERGNVQLRARLDEHVLRRSLVQQPRRLRPVHRRRPARSAQRHRKLPDAELVLLTSARGRNRTELSVNQAKGSATSTPNTSVR